jgi:hypothetical protein
MPQVLFTTANAKEMALRGAIVRKERYAQRKAAAKEAKQRARFGATVVTESSPAYQTGYVAGRLTRIRAHIARLDERLAAATEPLDCERLMRALSLASELERVLDGRPLPGSRRPGKERSTQDQDVNPV